jgi:hypothetical protein
MKRIVACGLTLFVFVALAGCGDGKGVVKGTVTLDGKAVADGSVTFVKSEGGQVREGAVIKDGAFTARVPPGKYKVELNGQKVTGTRKQKGFDGKDEEVPLTEELFPEKYNTKTELTEEIPAGGKTVTLDLKSGK